MYLVLMFGHDVLLGSTGDIFPSYFPGHGVKLLWKWEKMKDFSQFMEFTGRTRSETRCKGCVDMEGDKRVLCASEEEMQLIILVMEFNFRLDEALSYPA